MQRLISLLAVLLLILVSAPAAPAATISIVNLNAPGEGFNDPTPVDPAPGNPATTLGGQRLYVFQAAADAWGQLLVSDVNIEIGALLTPLYCENGGAVLGSAGTTFVFMDFPNAPLAGTWYHAALANALAAEDLLPGDYEIISFYNSDLDTGCLGPGTGWYYGLDQNPPAGTLDFYTVLLHEFSHGLGFANFIDEATGQLLQDFPDVFSHFTQDVLIGKNFNEMTLAQRQEAIVDCQNVVWTGSEVTQDAPNILSTGVPALRVDEPQGLAGSHPAGQATFAPQLTSVALSGELELVNDNVAAASATDGCEPLVGFTAGKIAFIDRGSCDFSLKVAHASQAGAMGVVVANYEDACPPMSMGGLGNADTNIPSVLINKSLADQLKAELAARAAVRVSLLADETLHNGVHPATGQVMLFSPNPVQQGSSISHYDTSCYPNQLMEPSINPGINISPDLTLPAFRDIGWQTTGDKPVVTAFNPASGGPGDLVTIEGAGFDSVMSVGFGTVPAASFQVLSPSQARAVVGEGKSGPVTVSTPWGTGGSATDFTFHPAPVVASFSPATATVGDLVVISGQNFDTATDVRFGHVPAASFSVDSATQITAVVGQGASGQVAVENLGGVGRSDDLFTYYQSPPVITGFSPAAGGEWDLVEVEGDHFIGASRVSFGGVDAAVFTVINDSLITAHVGAGATGRVSVTTPGGSGESAADFTFIPAPVISGFTPALGGPGFEVVITGQNFTNASHVSLGGVSSAGFRVDSDTQITAQVGAGATGKVRVTTPGGSGESAADFTFVPAPVLDGFTPAKARKDEEVVITGQNLANASSVRFGPMEAAFTVNSDTRITATVPAEGDGRITVTTPGGAATSADVFTLLDPGSCFTDYLN